MAASRSALVTGGAGFFGRHLVAALVQEGWAVRSLDLAPSTEPGVDSIVADVTDAGAVARACAGVEVVFSLAALLPQRRAPAARMREVNVGGTANALRAAREAGVRAFVLLSSAEVYGVPASTPCPEGSPKQPNGEYGRNKLAAEDLAREAVAAGLHVVILRPPTIVGPGMPEPLLNRFLDDARRGRPLVVIGRGATRVQMIAPSDAVAACLGALEVPEASGDAFNIGSEDVPTQREMAEQVRTRIGSRSRIVRVPVPVFVATVRALGLIGKAPLEPEHLEIALRDYVFDISKAKRVLGWKPEKSNVDALVEAYEARGREAER